MENQSEMKSTYEEMPHPEIRAGQLIMRHVCAVMRTPNAPRKMHDKAKLARSAALVTVEELIRDSRNVAAIMYDVIDQNPFDSQLLYWQQVKASIEKVEKEQTEKNG